MNQNIVKIYACVAVFTVNLIVFLERIRDCIIFKEALTIVDLLIVLLTFSTMFIMWLIVYDLRKLVIRYSRIKPSFSIMVLLPILLVLLYFLLY